MSTIERKDLVRAVLVSRDELDPGLETDLLIAIVTAEAEAAGDAEVALRAIEAAVGDALKRGVGRTEPTVDAAPKSEADESGEEGKA